MLFFFQQSQSHNLIGGSESVSQAAGSLTVPDLLPDFASSFPDDLITAVLGDTLQHAPQAGTVMTAKGFFSRDIEQVGRDGYTIERRAVVQLLKKYHTSAPKRGDGLVCFGESFVIDAVTDDDGAYFTCVLRQVGL